MIYKILPKALWGETLERGALAGAPVDLADGYIHFSTAAQVAETARRHFAGQQDLVVLSVDPVALGANLKWEPSRGGDLFPHLYANLPVAAVIRAEPLPLDADGHHVFPEGIS